MEEIVKVGEFYFKPFIKEAIVQQKVQEIGATISKKYKDGPPPLFVGVLNGVFIFMADLLRACDLQAEVAFIKLSSYKGLTSSGMVETELDLNMNITGRPVILVEDIVDSGFTLHHFIPSLFAKKPKSIELAALLVKPDAIKFPVEIHYFGFEIPSAFVIGYGLDYNGFGRNLRSIYQKID